MTSIFDKIASKLASAGFANAENSDVTQFLTTGFLPLDLAISGRAIGGGFPVRRVTEISGPESSGKTAIATQAMKAAQDMGGAAIFMDHERSFKMSLAIGLGIDPMPGKWNYFKPETFEESVQMMRDTCRLLREAGLPMDAPICVVFDSLPTMIPKQRLIKSSDENTMNDMLALARCTSQHLPVVVSAADNHNAAVLILNQLRLKPGVMYGDPNTTPGGNAPKYYASVRIQLANSRVMDGKGPDAVMVGSEITARCIKNKVNRPFLKAKWRFTFREDGSGYFDIVGSMVDFLNGAGVLEKKGDRIIWEGVSYWRNQLVKKLTEEPGSQKILEDLMVTHGIEVEVDETAAAEADGANEETRKSIAGLEADVQADTI